MNLYEAARAGDEQAVRELLAAGADPEASYAAAYADGWLPIHVAARQGHVGVVQLLVEAAPATVAAICYGGGAPLDLALMIGDKVLTVARYLVRAAPTVQPTLRILFAWGLGSASLYPDLDSRLALTQQEWESIPAPCPQLARALPAVLQRSEEEAGWLVGRLGEKQCARLRLVVLCMRTAAARVRHRPWLPPELWVPILVAALEPKPQKGGEA